VEFGLAFLVIVAAIGVWVLLTYNRLVALNNATKTASGQVEVQLQLRYDLIPALVSTVQGYADHENATLREVIEARSGAIKAQSPSEIEAAEATLIGSLGRLMLLTESYPNLKADQNFLSLQQELSQVESALNFARRFYNENVNVFNTAVESFPAILIARSLGFGAFELYAAKPDASEPPKIEFRRSR
jgi:LemA protein